MAACGVTLHALCPIFTDASAGKFWFGIAHSLVGVVLVLLGGFRLFERIMGLCIALMFTTAVVTAIRIAPDWGAVAAGLVVPRIADAGGQGITWTIALMGGVGGTLTVLCYGYWIRESGREGPEAIRLTRIDLATAYTMTAIFGLAMVIIGSSISIEGRGANLIVALGDSLEGSLGKGARWMFLLGAWGAVFSSLLGVWQSVPYVFAEFCRTVRTDDADKKTQQDLADTTVYRLYLLGMATIPILALRYGFRDLQKYYAVIGAFFMPCLAITLIVLNGRRDWIGADHRNRPVTTLFLLAILVFFAATGIMKVRQVFGW